MSRDVRSITSAEESKDVENANEIENDVEDSVGSGSLDSITTARNIYADITHTPPPDSPPSSPKSQVVRTVHYALPSITPAQSNPPITPAKPSISSTQYCTFKDVVKVLQERYTYRQSTNSLALDLISIYLEGQKILYIESKTYCEIYLYRLMLPAIFISSLSSVISGIFKDVEYASMAVSFMTAINAFILSIVTYLKLDAKAEAHKSSAYSFEKLQALCEFKSGKILLTSIGKDEDQVMSVIDEMEEKVQEIKEKNQFILPEAVRFRYPLIYTTNIFSEVKQIQTEEMVQINNLKVTMNRGVDLQRLKEGPNPPADIDTRIYDNYLEKNQKIALILLFRKEYNRIDSDFKKEIKKNIDKIRNRRFRSCSNWLKT